MVVYLKLLLYNSFGKCLFCSGSPIMELEQKAIVCIYNAWVCLVFILLQKSVLFNVVSLTQQTETDKISVKKQWVLEST